MLYAEVPMALLRPSELARFWELHPKTVYHWIREGKLPAFRTPGAQYRVRTDDALGRVDGLEVVLDGTGGQHFGTRPKARFGLWYGTPR